MKIKDLREIIKHFESREYDDWDVKLWDYNNQRNIKWPGGCYGFSKDNKYITFTVDVPPVDGKKIDDRIEQLLNQIRSEK